MIFKQETIQSWFSGVGSSINNEVIQPFQNAEQVIWKYNQAIQHNSLTQQGWERLLAQSDDSLKAYLTSIKGTTATMTGYNVSLQGNITGFKKVSSAITQYNALSASGIKEQNIFANAVSVTNGKLGTYLTGLNGAKASLGGYVISLVGATVKTVALKVATIALNSAITMGASLIISGVVSAISEWIHKTENMISASEDAIEKIKSINDELKNNQKTISDTAKRYAELAQGVDQLTGKNISLSNEDYEEFLTLSNQLAEMFPTLTRNYNDNGDAIVQLSGDVDTIVGSLQNLIEAQRDLANRQIVDELPTVFDGVAAKSDKYEQQLSDLKSRRDTLVKSLGDVQSEEFSSNFMDGFSNKWIEISGDNLEVISQMRDDYMKILKEANIDFEELTPTYEMKDGIEVPVGFTIKINSSDEDVEKAKNTIDGKIQELASQYETDINKLNEEINTTNEKNKANWTSLSSSIFAWLSTDDSFKVMDDTMQATVQNIVNSLDWGSLDFSSWEDAKQYIQDNILSLFNTPEGKETLADIEVMFGIQTQLNNGDITVEQYQQKLQDFLNSIESLPPETKKSILLLFGIQTNDDGTTTSDVDTMVENVKKKLKGTEFDDKVGELSLGDLKIAADLEVGDDTIQSWDDLIERIEKVKTEGNETDIFKSFNDTEIGQRLQHATKLFNEGKISYKEYFNGLQTEIENVDFSHYTDSLEDAQNAAGQLFVDTTQQAAQGLTNLINSFNSNEMSVTEYIDSYLSIAETLGTLTDELQENSEAWDKNGKALSESENINLDGVQSDLNSAIETIKSYQDSIYGLEQILSGKLELGTDEFTAQTNVIAEDLANIVSSGGEMSEEIKNYMGDSADEIAQSLTEDVSNFDIASQAIAANTNVAIQNMATSIGELFEELGEAISNFKVDLSFGVSSITMQDVDMGILGTHQLPAVTFSLEASGDSLSSIGSAISSFGKNFSENLGQYIEYPDFTIEPEGDEYVPSGDVLNNYNKQLEKLKDASGKAGKDAGEAYKEALEDELSDLNSVLGYISDIIEDQIDLFNDQKDAAVDALNAEKEAAEAALQAQIDLLEAQIEGIEAQIEAKEKEIESIEEARKQRELDIAAQKAQYNLARMQSQKIGLIYKGEPGQMVYETDTQGIRDAREEYDKTQENLKINQIEKEISLLEDEISNLEDVIDSLNNQIEASNKYYEDLIKSTENYYDGLIKNLEDYQNRWKEIGEIEEQAKIQVKLKELGITTEDILNMSEDAFNSFKQQYLSILTEMYSGEQDMIQAINDVANGIDVTTLTEGLNQTKENIDNLNESDFNSVSTGLNDISDGMGNVGTSASSASESTSSVSSDLQEMNTNAEGLDTKLSNISSALTNMPDGTNLDGLATSFANLGEAIKSVADILGVGEEGTIGGLVSALSEISNFSLENGEEGNGIISQFNNLKSAVDDVTSAISGGGTSAQSKDASNSSSPSMSAGNPGTGEGGLTGAIDSIKTTTDNSLGSGGEKEGTGKENSGQGEGVIGKFGQFKSAVDAVTTAIGTGEEGEGEISLIGALQSHYEKAEETLPEVKNMFEELLLSIQACANALGDMGGALSSMSGISVSTTGVGYSKGTVGKAFAKGTGKYKGLPKDEKNALRSEYGQPELTVYPDGTTELTTEPTMSDLPKDTVIFNEEQTKRIMSNKGTVIGNAYAEGNATVEKSSQFDNMRDLQPGDRMYDLLQKWNAYFEKNDHSFIEPVNAIQKNTEEIARSVSNVNTNNIQRSVNIGDINITCPGVTSNEVAKQITTELHKQIGGIALEALQESHITR